MHLPPITVLLIEDNRTDALLLRELLVAAQSRRFQVTTATRLGEALQRLAAESFDVVLLDLGLPDSRGLATFTALHGHAAAVPIIVLTGLDDETLAVEAVQAGAQDYLVKGQVEGNGLIRAIRYALERHWALEALQQQRDWLDGTLSSIGDAVIATDTSGTVTFINRVAVVLTAWPMPEAVGSHVDTVFRIVDERTRQVVESPVMRALRDGTVVSLRPHTVLLARDGRTLPIADSAAPIRNSQGILQGAVLVFRDISERRRLEAQLLQAQKMQAIGVLAGGIAHDFNNILAAVLGFTELAAYDVPQASPAWHCLQNVLRAGKRARDLVQQILAFSRQTTAEHRPLHLHGLIKEALTLMRASLPSTVEIRQDLAPDAGPVLADPTHMHQVLMNLCANAEYAMRETGGVLEVRLEALEVDATTAHHADLRPGPYVRLTVRDTGPGIPPDLLERIFEPFFTTKEVGQGTGMGLAMVHGIVTNHGGVVTASSVPGQGATFEVYLPRIAATTLDDNATEEPIPRGHERILLVDDEVAIARLGQELLVRLGYDVVTCLSSLEALQVFQAEPQRFDLVITDQTMPYMTGQALARALRGIRPDIPIILCTGFSPTVDTENAAALGMNAFLTKPWQARDLAHAVRQALEPPRT